MDKTSSNKGNQKRGRQTHGNTKKPRNGRNRCDLYRGACRHLVVSAGDSQTISANATYDTITVDGSLTIDSAATVNATMVYVGHDGATGLVTVTGGAYLKKNRPDAIVCGNDTTAAYLGHTLDVLGIRVPEDIMLAGFDDVQHAYVMSPQLTTIHQPCHDIADVAVRRLLSRIEDPNL